MITKNDFERMIRRLGTQATDDIAWSESVKGPRDAESFAYDAIWVICCSGMKATVARLIETRVLEAIESGRPIREVFGHDGKAAAMERIWRDREKFWTEYQSAEDKLAYLTRLPWIGEITKFHLAKNFGLDVAKPDVHLQRCADREGAEVQDLCARLASETGYRIPTVDLVIWRACATGVYNSRTGEFAPEQQDLA